VLQSWLLQQNWEELEVICWCPFPTFQRLGTHLEDTSKTSLRTETAPGTKPTSGPKEAANSRAEGMGLRAVPSGLGKQRTESGVSTCGAEGCQREGATRSHCILRKRERQNVAPSAGAALSPPGASLGGPAVPQQLPQPLPARGLGAAGREGQGQEREERGSRARRAAQAPLRPRGSEALRAARGCGPGPAGRRGGRGAAGERRRPREARGRSHTAPRARSGTAGPATAVTGMEETGLAGHSPAVGPLGHEPRQDAADHPPEDGHDDDGHRQATVRHGGAAAERSGAAGGAEAQCRRAAPRPAGQSAAATSHEREAAPFAARGAARGGGAGSC